MERSLFLLGSHPALSAVEVMNCLQRVGVPATPNLSLLPSALIVESAEPLDLPGCMTVLGGVPMTGRRVASLTDQSPEALAEVTEQIIAVAPSRVQTIALSILSDTRHLSLRDLRTLGISLKRLLDRRGIRLLFPTRDMVVSSAQLFHARIPKKGIALLLHDSKNARDVYTITVVQDIQRYTEIDRGRPHADPGSGMLPPKLAQMLINVSRAKPGVGIYDPFCGTGTVPLMALLQGHPVAASDVSPTQTDRTHGNLAWARKMFTVSSSIPSVTFTHDIVQHRIQSLDIRVGAIVTEGWLGKARTTAPSPKDADATIARAYDMTGALLRHVHPLLPIGGVVVTTLPAFRVGKRIVRATDSRVNVGRKDDPLPSSFIVDPLTPKEWNHPIFRGSTAGTLLYGRPDAIVLREIIRFRKTS